MWVPKVLESFWKSRVKRINNADYCVKHIVSVKRSLPDENFSWNAIKYNDLVKIIHKLFRRPLAKEVASRISENYFKADEIFHNIEIFHNKKFQFFHFTLNNLQNSKTKSVFVCVHSHIHSYLWRKGVALLSPLTVLLFFFFRCHWELGSFSPSQWLLEKAFFLTWGYILAIHLNTALQ